MTRTRPSRGHLQKRPPARACPAPSLPWDTMQRSASVAPRTLTGRESGTHESVFPYLSSPHAYRSLGVGTRQRRRHRTSLCSLPADPTGALPSGTRLHHRKQAHPQAHPGKAAFRLPARGIRSWSRPSRRRTQDRRGHSQELACTQRFPPRPLPRTAAHDARAAASAAAVPAATGHARPRAQRQQRRAHCQYHKPRPQPTAAHRHCTREAVCRSEPLLPHRSWRGQRRRSPGPAAVARADAVALTAGLCAADYTPRSRRPGAVVGPTPGRGATPATDRQGPDYVCRDGLPGCQSGGEGVHHHVDAMSFWTCGLHHLSLFQNGVHRGVHGQ